MSTLPVDILLGLSRSEELPQSQGQYLKTLLFRMEEVHHQARQHLRQTQLTQKKYYDLKAQSQVKGTLCTRKTWDAKQVSHANCVLCLWVHLSSKLYSQMICTVKPSIMIVSANVRNGPYLSGYAVTDIWMVLRSKVLGDTTIAEGVNSDLDETVAVGEDVPEASGETDMASEEVLAVSSGEDPERNFETQLGSTEPDELQRGRVRRRPTYLRYYCT